VRRTRLITKNILRAFADLVHVYQDRLYRLWIVSPWLSTQDDNQDSLILLTDALRDRGCTVILVTRPPEAAWHQRALEHLRANCDITVYFCSTLHTKLYVLECNGFRAAILGSANFTARANRTNRELAIELRTTTENPVNDDVAGIISELTEYASSLRGEPDVELA